MKAIASDSWDMATTELFIAEYVWRSLILWFKRRSFFVYFEIHQKWSWQYGGRFMLYSRFTMLASLSKLYLVF